MDDAVFHGQLEILSSVSEMGALDVGLGIPVNERIVNKIKARDPEAKFVVMELQSGRSRSRRTWPADILRDMERWVNEKNPVGYKGHIPENLDHTAFPDVHAIWLGAKSEEVKGKVKLRLKGYLKTQEIRDEIEMEMITGISPRGNAKMRPAKGGGFEVLEFEGESIDFARKDRNGLPSRVLALTSEQVNEGGGKVEPKDIAALSEEELRQHAPLLVKEIERKAAEPLQKEIGEQAEAVEELKPFQLSVAEIREKLGLGEEGDIVKAVGDLLEKVETASKAEIRGLIDKAIEKVTGKNEIAANVVRRFVGEQLETEFNGDVTQEQVDEKLKELVEGDDTIKAVVGEQVEFQTRRNDGSGGSSLGGLVRRQATNVNSDGERRSRTGGVTFSKRKVGS